jgi:hypothetical protein
VGIATGIAAVSSASIFIRYAQREAPSLVIAAARLALASLILAPIAWARYAEYCRLTRSRGWLSLRRLWRRTLPPDFSLNTRPCQLDGAASTSPLFAPLFRGCSCEKGRAR